MVHLFLGIGAEGNAGGDVLRLLHPYFVIDAILLKRLCQCSQGVLIWGLRKGEDGTQLEPKGNSTDWAAVGKLQW